ncbi:MAG TPA: hypothetical protein EYQ37_04860 [Candidatus Marinimicrobia bacterium]|nr:hypothetical protein [Candidatus Neomarinimicrobiota bacterium]
MKIISITLLWFSISFCQTTKQSSGALNPNIGMSAGAYANAGTDKMDVDGFFEIQFINGLYGDVWFSNLDMDSETSLEFNSSLGWIKKVAPDLTLAGGISNNTELNLTLAEGIPDILFGTVRYESLNEFFIGGNISLFTGLAFFGINDTPSNFIGIFDLNFGPLKNIPVDLSVMSVTENSASDLFFMLKKTTTKGFTAGYTFSRERFESEETRTFTKQGHTKSITVPVQQDGFFNTIYIGVTF